MEIKKLCIFNWSGGKDSTLALHYVLQDPTIQIQYLVTTISESYNRISMHGVRESLLIKQAESIGIPLYQIRLPELPDMETYDRIMHIHLTKFREQGITHSIFGDIFLEDLRVYRENQHRAAGLKVLFPLWKRNTTELLKTFLNLNYHTIVVCAQQNLKEICGKVINIDFINTLPAEIDPCGENGEFHTFVFNGPIFRKNIGFKLGELVFRTYPKPLETTDVNENNGTTAQATGFWYMDLID